MAPPLADQPLRHAPSDDAPARPPARQDGAGAASFCATGTWSISYYFVGGTVSDAGNTVTLYQLEPVSALWYLQPRARLGSKHSCAGAATCSHTEACARIVWCSILVLPLRTSATLTYSNSDTLAGNLTALQGMFTFASTTFVNAVNRTTVTLSNSALVTLTKNVQSNAGSVRLPAAASHA